MPVLSSVAPDTARGGDFRANARSERRWERYEARAVLWEIAGNNQRVRRCGRSVRSREGVTVKVTETPAGRVAGFSGLETCGSVWVCPVCSAKIAAARQADIQEALGGWVARGGRVVLGTFTMRHRAGQGLVKLWGALTDAWQAATSGRAWHADQDAFGTMLDRVVKTGKSKGQVQSRWRIHSIRVVELTHGVNGWHVHIHCLLLVHGAVDDFGARMLGSSMFERWRSSMLRSGLAAPTKAHGVDFKLMHGDPAAALGEYFTKAVYRASYETARGDLKDARGGNRKPFEILADLVRFGEAADLDLWREFEEAARGRRQIAWSLGLRDVVGMNSAEATDEEIAERDEGGEVAVAIALPLWAYIARCGISAGVLDAFERSHLAGVDFLARCEAQRVGRAGSTSPPGG